MRSASIGFHFWNTVPEAQLTAARSGKKRPSRLPSPEKTGTARKASPSAPAASAQARAGSSRSPSSSRANRADQSGMVKVRIAAREVEVASRAKATAMLNRPMLSTPATAVRTHMARGTRRLRPRATASANRITAPHAMPKARSMKGGMAVSPIRTAGQFRPQMTARTTGTRRINPAPFATRCRHAPAAL